MLTADFWAGVKPSGGFEQELATELLSRSRLDELEVVEIPGAELSGGGLGDADLAVELLGERVGDRSRTGRYSCQTHVPSRRHFSCNGRSRQLPH